MKRENKEVFISTELLRESTTDELEGLITETKKKLLELRTEAESAGVKKPHLIRGYKKLIARAKTVLKERLCPTKK